MHDDQNTRPNEHRERWQTNMPRNKDTGEPDNVKALRPVRRGPTEKARRKAAPRRRPTLRLRAGDPVVVTYLVADPREAILGQARDRLPSQLISVAVLVVVGPPFAFLLMAVRRRPHSPPRCPLPPRLPGTVPSTVVRHRSTRYRFHVTRDEHVSVLSSRYAPRAIPGHRPPQVRAPPVGRPHVSPHVSHLPDRPNRPARGFPRRRCPPGRSRDGHAPLVGRRAGRRRAGHPDAGGRAPPQSGRPVASPPDRRPSRPHDALKDRIHPEQLPDQRFWALLTSTAAKIAALWPLDVVPIG
jgi:hypothetical protein